MSSADPGVRLGRSLSCRRHWSALSGGRRAASTALLGFWRPQFCSVGLLSPPFSSSGPGMASSAAWSQIPNKPPFLGRQTPRNPLISLPRASCCWLSAIFTSPGRPGESVQGKPDLSAAWVAPLPEQKRPPACSPTREAYKCSRLCFPSWPGPGAGLWALGFSEGSPAHVPLRGGGCVGKRKELGVEALGWPSRSTVAAPAGSVVVKLAV